MKSWFTLLSHRFNPWVVLIAAGLALATSGCSKSEEEEVAATPASTEAAASAEEEQAAEEQSAPEETTTDVALEPMNVDETLRGSDAAVQAKDWGSATDALLKLQMSGSIQNDQQSWDYNKRMTALQAQLIEAADSGDPKAQQAMELLRRSRRIR